MFTVKECTQENNACNKCSAGDDGCALCKELGAPVKPGDRIFVLNEDGPRAIGILRLAGAKVQVVGVFGDVDESYRDIVNRSLLHVCRCMKPITVRAESNDAYWKAFGFTPKDGGMEILSSDINFGH